MCTLWKKEWEVQGGEGTQAEPVKGIWPILVQHRGGLAAGATGVRPGDCWGKY